MTNKPLVSYVIGVRNMERTVGRTIESIMNQKYPNKEIIVINDGSDDNTVNVLKKYSIKVITTEKIGISNARNLGYKNSKGDFIAFTDADCELDPYWTDKILRGFKDNEVGLIGGRTIFRINESFSSVYRSVEFSKRYKNIENRLVFWAGGPGSMFRRKVIDEIGGFKPEWVHGEDTEISFLTIEHGYKILNQSEAITYHIPESVFWRLVRKGYRDAKAHVRVVKSHSKNYISGKFINTWYFHYDLIILPILYLFIILSIPILSILFFIDFFFGLIALFGFILEFFIKTWLMFLITVGIFCVVYSLIPSFIVSKEISTKKLKAFLGTFLLHNVRCFAWGLGLLVGIKNLIIKK